MLPVNGKHLGVLLDSLVFGLTMPEPEYSRKSTEEDLVDLAVEVAPYGRVGVYIFLSTMSWGSVKPP